jgi:hypothetical protein
VSSAPRPDAVFDTDCRYGSLAGRSLPLSSTGLLQFLGYHLAEARPAMRARLPEIAAKMLAHGSELVEPAFAWRVVPVSLDTEPEAAHCLPPWSTSLLVGQLIRAELRGSEALAVFVATIGPRLEENARALLAGGKLLEGWVLDAVGSLAAEAVADVAQREVQVLAAAQGWKATNRFSPGYCTWETAGQHALFSLLPAQPAGVTLNDSALMTPLKSVSGVVGIGPAVEYRAYRCEVCTMTGCPARRGPTPPAPQ